MTVMMIRPRIVRCSNLIGGRPAKQTVARRFSSCTRPVRAPCRVYNDRSDLDPDTVEAVNEVSTRTLKILMKEDLLAAATLQHELTETRSYLLETNDLDSANFIAVLQGLLEHEIVEEARSLKGPYLRAYNQLFNAVQNSNWKLRDEAQDSTASRVYERQEVEDDEQDFYRVLGVSSSSGPEDLKQAFRQLALQWHPDVNKDPKAEDKFIKIREAYDVLSDPKSRALYDKYGAEGMKNKSGAHSGDGNADRFWSEFKPFKKETRKTKARAAGLERSMEDEEDAEPQSGDLVEYPLSDLVKNELQDGREKGVGLLVGRNKDRGDAKKLPVELLELCEIEPLRQEEANSTRWIPDELGCSAFCDLSFLKKIPVKSYDNRFDVWEFETELSEGCGGPEIIEEIIL